MQFGPKSNKNKNKKTLQPSTDRYKIPKIHNLTNKSSSPSQTFSNFSCRIQRQIYPHELNETWNKTKIHYKLSKPKEIEYTAKTEPSLLNSFISPEKTKEGLAKFNLIYYPNNNNDPSKTFTSFNDILSYNKDWTHEFNEPYDDKHMITQQLYYNLKQKSLIENSHKINFRDSYFSLFGNLKTMEKKMKAGDDKLKTYVNDKDKDMKAMLAVQKLIETAEKENEDSDTPKIKKVKSTFDFLENVNLHFKFYWYRVNNFEWKPGNREGSTLTFVNGKCYLYGGKARKVHESIIELDPKKWTWQKLVLNNDQTFLPRLGHTAVAFKKQLLIYGGEYLYNAHLKVRDCLGDLRLIDFETKECKNIKTYGDFFENRRNHASCLFAGKFLFIHGGVNSNGRYLKDLMYLNLETSKWSICSCEEDLDAVAFHSMIAVYRIDIHANDIYKAFDLDYKTKINTFNKIKEEGIYVFGGMNDHQIVFNRLKILKLGCYPLKWIEPETKGEPPLPCYLHSMNFYQDLNIIIIYGGRNDSNHDEPILSDVCVLNVFNLCWSKVSLFGLGNVPKCSHASTIVGSKLVVFGGYTLQEYIPSDVYILELNQDISKHFIEKNRFNLDKDGNDLDESINSGMKTLDLKKEPNKFLRPIRNANWSTYLPIPGEDFHVVSKN